MALRNSVPVDEIHGVSWGIITAPKWPGPTSWSAHEVRRSWSPAPRDL